MDIFLWYILSPWFLFSVFSVSFPYVAHSRRRGSRKKRTSEAPEWTGQTQRLCEYSDASSFLSWIYLMFACFSVENKKVVCAKKEKEKRTEEKRNRTQHFRAVLVVSYFAQNCVRIEVHLHGFFISEWKVVFRLVLTILLFFLMLLLLLLLFTEFSVPWMAGPAPIPQPPNPPTLQRKGVLCVIWARR